MVMLAHTVSPFRKPPGAYGYSQVLLRTASLSSAKAVSIPNLKRPPVSHPPVLASTVTNAVFSKVTVYSPPVS